MAYDGSVVGCDRVVGCERGWMGAPLDVGGRVRRRRRCDADGVVERWRNDNGMVV